MLKELLTAPTEELGRWSRFIVFQLKLWRQCVKLLKQNRAGTQAAALAYRTIFGIVPLAIVMLMVFQLFPAYQEVGEKVKSFVYEQVHLGTIGYSGVGETEQGTRITDWLDKITQSFVLNKGKVTLFSVVIVIWAAIGLLTTMERAFNNICHVGRGRSFVQRITNYWAALTLGPLLLGLGFYIRTHYLVAGRFHEGFISQVQPVVPYIISVAALFFLYFVMPNKKVNVKAALWGAMVAALMWAIAKYLFSMYVTKFIPFRQIYGVMGLVPLSVLWIYITWWIVLFGLQLTFTTQHLKTLDAAEIAAMRGHDEYFIANDFTVIEIMRFVLERFENKQGPVAEEDISKRLNLPGDFAEKILGHLVNSGLLCYTAEPGAGYVPATDGANITLADITDAVGRASYVHKDEADNGKLKAIFDSKYNAFAKCTLKQILEEQINSYDGAGKE